MKGKIVVAHGLLFSPSHGLMARNFIVMLAHFKLLYNVYLEGFKLKFYF